MGRSNKQVYCPRCDKYFHYLGYARHRAMHSDQRKKEKRLIEDFLAGKIEKEELVQAGIRFEIPPGITEQQGSRFNEYMQEYERSKKQKKRCRTIASR
jgi:hypothetical protein